MNKLKNILILTVLLMSVSVVSANSNNFNVQVTDKLPVEKGNKQ